MNLHLLRTFYVRFTVALPLLLLPGGRVSGGVPNLDGQPYLNASRKFADTVLAHGRDTYGPKQTPLFVDGLHAASLGPACWQNKGETWILSNFASQQPLMRLLDGLTGLTDDAHYRAAAEETARHVLTHLVSPNGLIYWGGHMAWDLCAEKPVGQYGDTHEMKNHQPYYALMHRVAPAATRKVLETIWGTHVVDWSRLDYNRHGSVRKPCVPRWNHEFQEQIEVPFAATGENLSFCNVTTPLIHCGVSLAVLNQDAGALLWTRRLAYRWQQARDPKTGLCGGQLSYRKQDRAQEALGHVHPTINEAKIVAAYHQVSRYHHLPLALMHAAETLIGAGGPAADVGRDLRRWALDDLKVYGRRCYDAQTGKLVALMTDGTPLKWQAAQIGYYTPQSFAPIPPDGVLFWSYCRAYRETGDPDFWRMVCETGRVLGLGDLNSKDAAEVNSADWRLIYGLLELAERPGAEADRPAFLRWSRRVADGILKTQAPSGLFPRSGYSYARTGDDIPLALLHLAAALEGRRQLLPRARYDSRFFHCEFHGPLEEHQQKRADARTYDNLVFFGDR